MERYYEDFVEEGFLHIGALTDEALARIGVEEDHRRVILVRTFRLLFARKMLKEAW